MLVMMAQRHCVIWNMSSDPSKIDQIMCTAVEVLSGSHPIPSICKWETTYGIETMLWLPITSVLGNGNSPIFWLCCATETCAKTFSQKRKKRGGSREMGQKACCIEHMRDICRFMCEGWLRLVGFLDMETLKIWASDLKSQGRIRTRFRYVGMDDGFSLLTCKGGGGTEWPNRIR